MPEQLCETNSATATLTEATGALIDVELITPGWGSSGYYSAEVLESAGRDKVFAAGTHMYIDHPSASENHDRPERSLRDLAAVLAEDATWNGTALRGKARVFAPYQPLVAEMKDDIGVSIRAGGEVEMGEAEGRRGRIVTQLVNATSVDFVTRAGRGGRIAQLLESARPTATNLAEARNVGQWVESAIHRDFTVMADNMAGEGHLTREERIQMSSAIGDALAAFVANLEANAPQLYQRDLWDEPAAPAVSEGAPAPTDPPTRKGGLVPELTEAEVTALRDSAAQAEAARDAALAEAATLKAQIAESTARTAARPVVAAKVAESSILGERDKARLVESIVVALPVVDGKIADETLAAAVESAVKSREDDVKADYTRPTATPLFGSFGSVQESAAGGEQLAEADVLKSIRSGFGKEA